MPIHISKRSMLRSIGNSNTLEINRIIYTIDDDRDVMEMVARLAPNSSFSSRLYRGCLLARYWKDKSGNVKVFKTRNYQGTNKNKTELMAKVAESRCPSTDQPPFL